MEAVQVAVDRGVKQLGASNGPGHNASPGDEYRFPARTAQELQATQQQAAAQGQTNPLAQFNQLHDPAAQMGGAELAEVQPGLMLPNQDQVVAPAPPPPAQAPQPQPAAEEEGWLL